MTAILREWSALLLLIGTIVGVGMFAIPFVFVQAGFITGITELAVLAAAVTIVHLCYLEVVEKTPAAHRLPGYVRLYFGNFLGRLSTVSYFFGLSGSLLAYLALGGFFLGEIIRWYDSAIPSSAGTAIFYIIGAFVISRGVRFEGFANGILTIFLIFAIAAFGLAIFSGVSADELTAFHPERLFIPYGVVLFSLAGAAVIPDARRILGDSRGSISRRIVVIGTLIPAFLYLFFALAVVGATGSATTPDAMSGLAARFGPAYLIFGGVIGFLATITSFITLGSALEGMFAADLGFDRRIAPVIASAIPLALYLAGLSDFIAVISVVGALAIGLDSIFILFLHQRVAARASSDPQSRIAASSIASFALVIIFAAGIVRELAKFF